MCEGEWLFLSTINKDQFTYRRAAGWSSCSSPIRAVPVESLVVSWRERGGGSRCGRGLRPPPEREWRPGSAGCRPSRAASALATAKSLCISHTAQPPGTWKAPPPGRDRELLERHIGLARCRLSRAALATAPANSLYISRTTTPPGTWRPPPSSRDRELLGRHIGSAGWRPSRVGLAHVTANYL